MNKAFTRESDGEEELDGNPQLPQGVKNYITPGGYQRLKDEFDQLWKVERPELVKVISWAASNGDRSENGDYIYGKRRLREIDRRLRFYPGVWITPKSSIRSSAANAIRYFLVRR